MPLLYFLWESHFRIVYRNYSRLKSADDKLILRLLDFRGAKRFVWFVVLRFLCVFLCHIYARFECAFYLYYTQMCHPLLMQITSLGDQWNKSMGHWIANSDLQTSSTEIVVTALSVTRDACCTDDIEFEFQIRRKISLLYLFKFGLTTV